MRPSAAPLGAGAHRAAPEEASPSPARGAELAAARPGVAGPMTMFGEGEGSFWDRWLTTDLPAYGSRSTGFAQPLLPGFKPAFQPAPDLQPALQRKKQETMFGTPRRERDRIEAAVYVVRCAGGASALGPPRASNRTPAAPLAAGRPDAPRGAAVPPSPAVQAVVASVVASAVERAVGLSPRVPHWRAARVAAPGL